MATSAAARSAIRGLRTVIYKVNDLQDAKAWYTKLLGFAPYFEEPFYVGYNVGGFELGLDPDVTQVTVGNNVVAYWGVLDINAAVQRIEGLGAELLEPIRDVGGDIKVAVVKDPFGNSLGLIENPFFSPADVK